jgi:hypothetical protein
MIGQSRRTRTRSHNKGRYCCPLAERAYDRRIRGIDKSYRFRFLAQIIIPVSQKPVHGGVGTKAALYEYYRARPNAENISRSVASNNIQIPWPSEFIGVGIQNLANKIIRHPLVQNLVKKPRRDAQPPPVPLEMIGSMYTALEAVCAHAVEKKPQHHCPLKKHQNHSHLRRAKSYHCSPPRYGHHIFPFLSPLVKYIIAGICGVE